MNVETADALSFLVRTDTGRQHTEFMSSNALWTLSSKESLYSAWNALNKSNPGSKGLDGVTIQQFRAELQNKIAVISHDIRRGIYKFSPLKSVHIQKDPFKPAKGTRELKIPSIADRVVLKALQLNLSPALEKFNSPSSYAYRKKLKDRDWGIEPAALEIIRLTKIYPIAIEADIKSYFDTVPRQRLLDVSIKALMRPSLNALLADALKIDAKLNVNENATTWDDADFFGLDDRGIPQGSALSPLLANFYLSPFDFIIAARNIPLVRYADDLVLFAKSKEEAQVIFNLAGNVLRWLGLDIHDIDVGEEAKSRIRDLKREGLECLGYRFEQGTILPGSKAMRKFKFEMKELSDQKTIGKGIRRKKHGLRFDTAMSRANLLLQKLQGKAAAFRLCKECPQIQDMDRMAKESFLKMFEACGVNLRSLAGRDQIKLGIPRFKKLWKTKSKKLAFRMLPHNFETAANRWSTSIREKMKHWFKGVDHFLDSK